MKNKPYVFESERKKKDRKRTALILLIVLLISFIPWPWSLYGRDCLQNDGSIVQYNMFNTPVHKYSPSGCKTLRIETYRYSTGKYYKTRHFGVRMVFVMDNGREYTFEQNEFRYYPESGSTWLMDMINMKKRFDPSIIQYNLKDFNMLVDNNWPDEQLELLYQLFGQ